MIPFMMSCSRFVFKEGCIFLSLVREMKLSFLISTILKNTSIISISTFLTLYFLEKTLG